MNNRVVVPLSLLTAAAVLGGGCGGTAGGATVTEVPVPAGPPVFLEAEAPLFIPGEIMSWQVSLHGIVGGEAVLVVGEPGLEDGRRVIMVRSRVESTGVAKAVRQVRDEVTSLIDLDSGLPVSHQADMLFGDKHLLSHATFEVGGYRLAFSRKDGPEQVRRQALRDDQFAHDGHSIIGKLRAWHPDIGTRAYFYGLGGRRLWHNTIQLMGREEVSTAAGTYEALRFDGVARRLNHLLEVDRHRTPREYTVWISDDTDRLPLKVVAKTEYGDVTIELVEYHRPVPRLVSR